MYNVSPGEPCKQTQSPGANTFLFIFEANKATNAGAAWKQRRNCKVNSNSQKRNKN